MSFRNALMAILVVAFVAFGFAGVASAAPTTQPVKFTVVGQSVSSANASTSGRTVVFSFTAKSSKTLRNVTIRVVPSWKGGKTFTWKIKNFQKGRTVRRTVKLAVPSTQTHLAVLLRAIHAGKTIATKVVKLKTASLPVIDPRNPFVGSILMMNVEESTTNLVPGVEYTYQFLVSSNYDLPDCSFFLGGRLVYTSLKKDQLVFVTVHATHGVGEISAGKMDAHVVCKTAGGLVQTPMFLWDIKGADQSAPPPTSTTPVTPPSAGIARSDLTISVSAGEFSGVRLGVPVTPPQIWVRSVKTGVLNATASLAGTTLSEQATFPGSYFAFVQDNKGKWTYNSLEEICAGLHLTLTDPITGTVVFSGTIHDPPQTGSCPTPASTYGQAL